MRSEEELRNDNTDTFDPYDSNEEQVNKTASTDPGAQNDDTGANVPPRYDEKEYEEFMRRRQQEVAEQEQDSVRPVMHDSDVRDIEIRLGLSRPEAERVWHGVNVEGNDEASFAEGIKAARVIYRQAYEAVPAEDVGQLGAFPESDEDRRARIEAAEREAAESAPPTVDRSQPEAGPYGPHAQYLQGGQEGAQPDGTPIGTGTADLEQATAEQVAEATDVQPGETTGAELATPSGGGGDGEGLVGGDEGGSEGSPSNPSDEGAPGTTTEEGQV